MTQENFQDDFFGNQVSGKAGGRPRILSKYSKQRFLPHVRVPIEYTIIGAIGVLVLVIIAYAVGVEKGKRVSGETFASSPGRIQAAAETDEELDMSFSGTVEEEWPVPAETEEADLRESAEDSAGRDVETAAGEEEAPGSGAAPYIIQLASFKNRSSAEREIKELEQKGYEARSSKKGLWYQVYASGYRTIDEAKRAQRRLSEDYQDCYIRKVQ
jgi:hypothetical protein